MKNLYYTVGKCVDKFIDNKATIVGVTRIYNSFPSFINLEDNQELMKEVGKEKLHMTLQSVKRDKIIGLDGSPMGLFFGCYDFIKEDLRRVVESSRNTRKTLASFNRTFIALDECREFSLLITPFTIILSSLPT